MEATSNSQQVGASPRSGSSFCMTRPNTSIMETPTPVNTTRLTNNTNPECGMAAVRNQLMGIDAIIANPPQLTVTSAASKVLLAGNRDPARLLRMYKAGSEMAQASPAAPEVFQKSWAMACVES